jgi:hypothetical protein
MNQSGGTDSREIHYLILRRDAREKAHRVAQRITKRVDRVLRKARHTQLAPGSFTPQKTVADAPHSPDSSTR